MVSILSSCRGDVAISEAGVLDAALSHLALNSSREICGSWSLVVLQLRLRAIYARILRFDSHSTLAAGNTLGSTRLARKRSAGPLVTRGPGRPSQRLLVVHSQAGRNFHRAVFSARSVF